jgi:hypothetical protein
MAAQQQLQLTAYVLGGSEYVDTGIKTSNMSSQGVFPAGAHTNSVASDSIAAAANIDQLCSSLQTARQQ